MSNYESFRGESDPIEIPSITYLLPVEVCRMEFPIWGNVIFKQYSDRVWEFSDKKLLKPVLSVIEVVSESHCRDQGGTRSSLPRIIPRAFSVPGINHTFVAIGNINTIPEDLDEDFHKNTAIVLDIANLVLKDEKPAITLSELE